MTSKCSAKPPKKTSWPLFNTITQLLTFHNVHTFGWIQILGSHSEPAVTVRIFCLCAMHFKYEYMNINFILTSGGVLQLPGSNCSFEYS